MNRWNVTSIAANLRDRITIIFEDVAVTSIEFDWQIFPVTTGKADIKVYIDGGTVPVFYEANDATTAQKKWGELGHVKLVFNSPVKKIEFVDWSTAPIGIDNLYVTSVPEPATWVLGMLGTVGLAAVRRRRAAA